MNAKTALFHLKVIDLANIVSHEEYDVSRAQPIADHIKKTGILNNPILVTNLSGKRFVQLDGMNRYSAMKILGVPSILTQVLDYNDQESVDLSTWCHLFAGEKNAFLAAIAATGASVKLVNTDRYLRRRYIKDEGDGFLCTIVFADGDIYRCGANGMLPEKVETLCGIVSFYEKQITRDILPDDANHQTIQQLFANHAGKNTLVIFPTFTRHQILAVVRKEKLFPGGLTRFIIKRRCLDVRYPLELLAGNSSEEEKNKKLEAFLAKKTYRLYEEPTIYFEPS